MSRLSPVNPDQTSGDLKDLLQRTQAALGRLPNLYLAMASSPAALEGYLGFRAGLVKGKLSTTLREQVALAIAQENQCEYCVSAHVFRGAKIGLSPTALQATRKGEAPDAKTEAALRFAIAVTRKHGAVSDSDLAETRAAGWSNEELGEIVAHVALNIYSNYFNHVAKPELDFPRVAIDDNG